MTSVKVRASVVGFVVVCLVLGGMDATGAASRQPLSVAPAARVAVAERVTTPKAPTSRLAKTDPALLGRNDATAINVVIKLDYDSIATYAGGLAGLPATAPAATGRSLSAAAASTSAYAKYVAGREQAFTASLARAVPSARVGSSLRVAYGGVAAVIPANSVKTVLAIPGVVAVQQDKLEQPLTDSSPEFVNATAVYSQLGTTANAGQGVLFGDLDTGLWPEHPSFADLGNLPAPPGPALTCDFGDNPLTPAVDVFACNNKLIGGQPFLDTYNAVIGGEVFPDSARDSNGHGTHTSSTTAGNIVNSAPVLGVDHGPIHGLAPGAYVAEYKVCGMQGCFSSDSAAAVGQAILDGVDVINFSISGGTQPFSDPVELAFLDAYAAGVLVSASAGNEGPGPATVNHLGPWTTTVAASTQARKWQKSITLYGGGTPDTVTIDGTGIVPDTIDDQTLVTLAATAPGYGVADCSTPAAPGTFTDQIVACRRSPNRVQKGLNVLAGGAVGMLLYNGPGDFFPEMSDSHFLPTVHTADGQTVLDFLANHVSTFATMGGTSSAPAQGDVMAGFSSRGPGGLFIKPDITAPGVQILAGNTPVPDEPASGPPGQYFQSIGGTSMSAPHVAGAAVLVRAVHPTWTPGQIKSALMTTAVTDVVKEDRVTPADPFDFGSGRIDIGAAASAALTFDESATDFFALGDDPVNAVTLNLPSIDAPVMPGRLVTTRTAVNTTGATRKFTVATTAPAGSSIKVSPTKFTLAPGASQVLTVTIESSATIGDQQFGQISITAGPNVMHLPVAFIHTQGAVTLSQECAPTTIKQQQTSTCEITATNGTFGDETVDLRTRTSSNLPISSATGATVVDENHAQALGVALAGSQPGVPSVDPGELFGYIPLDAFGVTPIAIGDEDIINFSVPPFMYNGESWNRIGVDSNGYAVVGGGTSEDNNCCNLPPGPSPARPNNILAPFWTDLDGTGTAGVFAATLTDGVNSWLVIEWRVHVFGTTDLRTFQTWIGIDATQDITFAYQAPQADPAGQPFLVGAENKLGQGDVEAVLPTADLRVTSTDFTAGESYTYSVTVRGTAHKTGFVHTEMTATTVPGVTVVETPIVVTKQ
jgi:subtilisin family serine protease